MSVARQPALDRQVLLLAHALEGAGIPFAFGGALALAYAAAPRSTVDVDVNVFVPWTEHASLGGALRAVGIEVPENLASVLEADGQERLWWGTTAVDLFLSYHPFHEAMRRRCLVVPFGDDGLIPVLSPEDLVVCKALFDRRKDWADIEDVLRVQEGFDLAYVSGWLEHMLGPDDERLRSLQRLVREVAEGS